MTVAKKNQRKPNPLLSPEVAAKFHAYLMGMSKPDRAAMAERCDSTAGQLLFVAMRLRTMRFDLAVAVDRETGGEISLLETRPDVDWSHVRAVLSRQ